MFALTSLTQASALTLTDFNPLGNGGITCLYSTSYINAPTTVATRCNPENGLLNRVETILYILAPAFAVIGVMYGGFQMMQSGYEANGKGMKAVKGSILGFVIVLSAFFIRDIVFKVISGTINTSNATYSNAGVKVIIDLLNTVAYSILVPIGTPVAVGFVIWGGYQLITAGGNPAQVKKGFDTIKNSILGFLVIVFAVVLVSIAQRFAASFLTQIK